MSLALDMAPCGWPDPGRAKMWFTLFATRPCQPILVSATLLQHDSIRAPQANGRSRRAGGRVHGSAPDAALCDCRVHGEAIAQLRFLPPAMLQACAVQRCSNPLFSGRLLRLMAGVRHRA